MLCFMFQTDLKREVKPTVRIKDGIKKNLSLHFVCVVWQGGGCFMPMASQNIL